MSAASVIAQHDRTSEIDPEHVVTDYNDNIVFTMLGRPLRVRDIAPERAALALESTGRLVYYREFEDRLEQLEREGGEAPKHRNPIDYVLDGIF